MSVVFILVEPARAANVGAVARAMKTTGFNELRVVNTDLHQSDEASWVAHGSVDVLQQAQAFPDLASALAGIDFSIATTARQRGFHRTLINASEAARLSHERQAAQSKVAIVFGREDSGLNNQELSMLDAVSYIPLTVDFPSLNLAQAVMVYAYEFGQVQIHQPLTSINTVQTESYQALKDKINQLSHLADFSSDHKLNEWLLNMTANANQRDINMWHTLTNDLLNKINGKSKGV